MIHNFPSNSIEKYASKVELSCTMGWSKSGQKQIVRVVLSPQHKELLDKICEKLGQSESETLRMAFLQYAEKLSLVTQKVHS